MVRMTLANVALVSASVAITIAAAVPARAADILEPAFSGTIVSTYPDGRISKLWLNRDGTFSAIGPNHQSQGGHWVVKGHNMCLSQTKPFPIPFVAYCAPIPSSGISENWTGKAVTGEPITIRLDPAR